MSRMSAQAVEGPRDWDIGPQSVRDLLTIVFKRKRIIFAFFLATVAVTALVAFSSSPIYEAKAAVLVKKSSVEMALVPTASSQLIVSQVSEEDLNSEAQILRSRQALEDALRALGVDEPKGQAGTMQQLRRAVSEFFGGRQLSYVEGMILHLESAVEVKPLRKSNILEITYRHTDPEWATRVVQTLAERYVTVRARVFQSPQAVAFFDEETKAAQARLEKAERALEAYSSQAGVFVMGSPGEPQALAAEKEATLQRATELERQLVETDVLMRQQAERVAALEGQLAQEPARLRSLERQDPTTEELERALVTLQLKRDALVQDFTPENRQVRDIEDQIRATQERLKAAEQRVAGINRTEINPVHQELRGQLLAARAELGGTRARYASLQAQVANHRRQLEELGQKGLTADGLWRETRAAEEAYMLYQKKHEEARITAAMDQQRIVNVSIAQPAQRPLAPVGPNKRMNLLLGVLFGAFGGVALAFIVEYFDHSFTTGRDLETRLGIPLLGAIPDRGRP